MLHRSCSRLMGPMLIGLTALLVAPPSLSQPVQKACVYDVVGTTGDVYNISRDYAISMQRYGAAVQLKAYTDERAAAEDFRTGQCDILLATAFRTRQFHQIGATTDALGATTILRDGRIDMDSSYEVVNRTAQIFASPAAARLMVEGAYELGGILPLGAAYPVLRDRRWTKVEDLAGKRIAAFDYDKAQAEMIRRIGAQPVSADITNFATMFNNGSVDMIGAPGMAYGPLELHKGLGKTGAVVRFPLLIITYQIILRKDRFPPGFGQKSREYWLSHFDGTKTLIYNAEKGIPASYWMELPSEASLRYALMLREARIEMTEKGLYNKRGLRILKKVRCSINPQDSECSTESELN